MCIFACSIDVIDTIQRQLDPDLSGRAVGRGDPLKVEPIAAGGDRSGLKCGFVSVAPLSHGLSTNVLLPLLASTSRNCVRSVAILLRIRRNYTPRFCEATHLPQHKAAINAFVVHQLVRRTILDDLPAEQHDDAIEVVDS